MTAESANEYSKLADGHLEAYRLACREKRSKDATREFRLHSAAMNAARAISTYRHEAAQ